jgi:lathosterol oxidase
VAGFAEAPLFAYIAFVSIQATFIHSNLRFELAPLARFLATPQFHHWHHGAGPDAVDVNFAVHLPLIDRLFGTHHLPPGRWPDAYGLAGGDRIPSGYLQQLVEPLRPGARPSH